MKDTWFHAVARLYLGKPDLGEFLAIRLPHLRAMTAAARNEIAFRCGLPRLSVLTTLNVELTSRCNVRCSYCQVNRDLGRPNTDLDPDLLLRLIETTPRLHTLLPFQWGEPLLYEPLDEVVGGAAARGVRTYLTTNGILLDGDRFRSLANAGLTRLTISLDGDPDTHLQRRGYAQAPVLRRLAEARAVQRRARLQTRLDVSMVVDRSVATQLDAFRRRLAPLCDRVQFIPRLTRGKRTRPCREPSRGVLVILSNGILTACCADVRGQLALGALGSTPLAQAYRSAPWIRLRNLHRSGDYPAPCAQCTECDVPGVSSRFS